VQVQRLTSHWHALLCWRLAHLLSGSRASASCSTPRGPSTSRKNSASSSLRLL
jgi:hypothetical protein